MHDKTILVIDDNQFILWLIRDILKKQGYNIVTAGSGMTGLKIANTLYPDLIILDRVLKDIAGDQILEIVKRQKETRSIPVTMLSSISDRQQVMKSWTLGANDYIVKPFNIQTLIEKVQRIIGPSGDILDRYYYV